MTKINIMVSISSNVIIRMIIFLSGAKDESSSGSAKVRLEKVQIDYDNGNEDCYDDFDDYGDENYQSSSSLVQRMNPPLALRRSDWRKWERRGISIQGCSEARVGSLLNDDEDDGEEFRQLKGHPGPCVGNIFADSGLFSAMLVTFGRMKKPLGW